MTTIPDDILAVAGVVTGDDRTNLGGWQRQDAIAAMTALGYSGTHIAWTMLTSRDAIGNVAAAMGIKLHRHDQHPDWNAVYWVTHHGARMALKGADRVEAVRGLIAKGYHSREIARRLQCSTNPVETIAADLGLTLPAAPPPADRWDTHSHRTGQRQAVAA